MCCLVITAQLPHETVHSIVGYYLNNSDDNKKVLCDLRPFLKAFCCYENAEFKNNFSYHDERLYLLRQSGDIFLFLVTRSKAVLHPLKGKRTGIWSIKVSGNWRVTFEFRDGNAYILNYEDYH